MQIVFTTIPCGTIGSGKKVGLYEVVVRGQGINQIMTVEAKGRKAKRVLAPVWSSWMGGKWIKLAYAFEALKLPEGDCNHHIVDVDLH